MTRASIFLAPDDADFAEGVAGQTWASNSRVEVRDLPCLDVTSPAHDITEYAKQAWVSEDWVRRSLVEKTLPQSLFGIPIEVRGRLWGVLVLDSRLPQGVKLNRAGKLISTLAVVLGRLLERVR
jgi:GAF domain-containing protein